MKSAACFCFPILKTLSSSSVVGALKLAFRVDVDCRKHLNFGLAPPYTLCFYSFTIGWYWILRPTWRLLSRVLTPPFLNNVDINTNRAPYRSPKHWVHAMIFYKYRLFLKEWGMNLLSPNHSYLSSLPPINKTNSMIISTRVKLTPYWINSRSFYTNTYGIEPLHTLINSRYFYTYKYGI